MRHWARLLIFPVAAVWLSGCVAMLPTGVVAPNGQLIPRDPKAEMPADSGEPPLAFRLRIAGNMGLAPKMADLLTGNSPLTSVVTGNEPADVILNWKWSTGVTGVIIEAASAYTSEVLFRCQDQWWTQVSAGQNLGGMLYAAFVPGGELYKKVVAQRALGRPAPAASPQNPANALTSEQIAQIVAQTMQAQVAVPAPAATAPDEDSEAPRYSRPSDPKKFAVIVGVESYADLPSASFAERDAAAIKSHALALGFPERNILSLNGARATKGGLVKSLETWLPRNVEADSTVLFYFSGHGAPDPATGQAYIMPSDGDPQFLEETAYSTKRLYSVLGKLKTKRVLVVMDACFSGAGGRSVLAKGTRPLVNVIDVGQPSGGIVALAAAGASQVTGADDAARHGLFTYYLLRGLNGAAKDSAGRVTARALLKYAAPNVQDAARRQNRDQTPTLVAADADDFSLR